MKLGKSFSNNGRVAYCCQALRCNFEVVDDERVGIYGDVRFSFDFDVVDGDECLLRLTSPTGSATKMCRAPQHAIATIRKYANSSRYRTELERGNA